MSRRNEKIKGLVGSIAFHVLLALFLFFWEVDTTVGEPEFIEVSWGSIASVQTSTPPRASMAGSPGGGTSVLTPTRRSVDLPERTLSAADEVLKIPAASKLDVDESPSTRRVQVAENARTQKERGAGQGVGEKENALTPGVGDLSGDIANPSPTGTVGNDVGSSVSVSMQWSDGGTRKKISGELPAYPEGVNVQAQIKIEAVVVPDGTVKSLKPAQKGNTKLEEAAMKEVRLWRFEPLKRSMPQADQVCVITFNFRLR